MSRNDDRASASDAYAWPSDGGTREPNRRGSSSVVRVENQHNGYSKERRLSYEARHITVFWANLAKMDRALAGSRMKTLSAEDAKYGFGRLIDLARAEPVAVAKHGRPVVAVMAVEEYERLFKTGHVDSRPSTTGKAE